MESAARSQSRFVFNTRAGEWKPSGKTTETWPVASFTTCQFVITMPSFSWTAIKDPDPYETEFPDVAMTRHTAGCGVDEFVGIARTGRGFLDTSAAVPLANRHASNATVAGMQSEWE